MSTLTEDVVGAVLVKLSATEETCRDLLSLFSVLRATAHTLPLHDSEELPAALAFLARLGQSHVIDVDNLVQNMRVRLMLAAEHKGGPL